jgi:dTDP-4-dehydrorhamnose reductase
LTPKKIVILGATGMLGHTLFSRLSDRENLDVYATARNKEALSQWVAPELLEKVFSNVDADNFVSIIKTLDEVKPDTVINCIGIIKQLSEAQDPIASITINALFPHRLAAACRTAGVRMIHISTDCVFSGDVGNYTEKDRPDAVDLYGRTKLLGEVEYPHCITLRTSIIGHELKGKHGLIEWFLSQEGKVRGFTHAIYSGFPTVEMARIMSEYVIPNKDLKGLYHVSSHRISKYDLLRLVAERYGKQIEIERYDDFCCDRSLDSGRFRSVTGYNPPSWPELINTMYNDKGRNQ